MKEPRPATISARPLEMRSSVAKFLKDADGVSGAKNCDGAGEADIGGAGGGRGEDDDGGGVEVLEAVVFAEAEDVEADLVGEFDLFEEVSHPFLSGNGMARDGVWNQCCEAIDANLHF